MTTFVLDILLYLASLKLSRVGLASGGGGLVVEKSNFNQQYIGGQRGHAPPLFTEVYTVNSSVTFPSCSLGYNLSILNLIYSVCTPLFCSLK